ncbi:MAG TPA: Omp28-related outer membrane protein, partial [Flavobacteriales bacterium]|nr:Omp28-related outer membrane protein [Flavobacteriales bacterium]
MKKTLTLLGLIPALASAQSLVNTTPENRTVLLEDFTGIHCGYCPEGHVIMAALEERFGPRYVGVGVHAGGFAVPQGNEPDFRTDEGTAIDAHFTISGYPAGVINRHLFDGEDDLGRGSWEGAVEQVLDMPSPVNLGVESSYDAGTQTLTVHTHALYTGDSPSGNDYISVLVTESHIIGYQADYTNGTHQNYDHLHVLRGYLTDTWGEDVGNHVAGETVDRTYTMAVPPEWNIANCEVVAFISEYQTEVYQARDVAADGGTTLVIGSMAGNGQPYRPGQDGTATPFDGTFTNLLNAEVSQQLLGEARTALDKAKIERARLILTIRDRDEECDSLRNMVAELARMAG